MLINFHSKIKIPQSQAICVLSGQNTYPVVCSLLDFQGQFPDFNEYSRQKLLDLNMHAHTHTCAPLPRHQSTPPPPRHYRKQRISFTLIPPYLPKRRYQKEMLYECRETKVQNVRWAGMPTFLSSLTFFLALLSSPSALHLLRFLTVLFYLLWKSHSIELADQVMHWLVICVTWQSPCTYKLGNTFCVMNYYILVSYYLICVPCFSA